MIPIFLGSIRNFNSFSTRKHIQFAISWPQLSFYGGLYVQNLKRLSESFVVEAPWFKMCEPWETLWFMLVKNNFASLIVLKKWSLCKLHHFPVIPSANLSSLVTLDLHYNSLDKYLIPSQVSDRRFLGLFWDCFWTV